MPHESRALTSGCSFPFGVTIVGKILCKTVLAWFDVALTIRASQPVSISVGYGDANARTLRKCMSCCTGDEPNRCAWRICHSAPSNYDDCNPTTARARVDPTAMLVRLRHPLALREARRSEGHRATRTNGDDSAIGLGENLSWVETGVKTETMFRLDGKVALVTGASRGIGNATARVLASQGAHVFVNYCQSEQFAQATVKDIEASGGKAHAIGFDITNKQAVDDAVGQIVKQTGGIDIVVANAGVSRDGLLLRVREEDLREMIEVNLLGSIWVVRAAISPMLRKRSGRIVFVSSVIGEMGNAGQTGYSSTKAALLGVMKSLSKELGSRGITVNAVTPGLIETDMTSGMSEELRAKALTHIALNRFGTVADVSQAIAYLCSEEAGYVTGHTLRVNGGMYV